MRISGVTISGIVGDFCRKHSVSVEDLAKKFGVSAAQIYAVAYGRRALRPMHEYALVGLARDLKTGRPMPRYCPKPKTPPLNRRQIQCPVCTRMMNRGNKTKDPDSGALLWRMFCKGDRKKKHQTKYLYVDRMGTLQPPPSNKHRRKLAPFERKDGITRCSECDHQLQWQEEFKHRWGYSKLYCFRCTNSSYPCSLNRKRVYRDSDGRAVDRDPGWRLKQRKPRMQDVCPVPNCNGRLWRAGNREHGNLRKLNCRKAIKTKGRAHLQNGIQYPGSFYYRSGRKVFYVYGSQRRPNGERARMRLERWIKQKRSKLSSEEFLLREGAREFTIQEFADALQIHSVTAGNKLLDLERRNGVQTCGARHGRRKTYRVTPIPPTS